MTTFESPPASARIARGTLHVLDGSDVRVSYVLDCDSGVQVRLSELAYRVVADAWNGASFEEIAIRCSDNERQLNATDVGRVYDRVVAGIDRAEEQQRTRARKHGFLLRRTLFPAKLAGRIATPFAALFGPVAVPVLIALVAAAAGAYWIDTQHVAPRRLGRYDVPAGYALFVVSCLAHEFGHAGACKRFAVRPGSIGLALYLVFPVFYSDVTRIWRLDRRRRIAVDCGGLYVQSICGACYAAIYVQTHAAALHCAITFIIAAALLDLNPLFRFDGYWIVSDVLGVSGLHAHVERTFRRLASRFARCGHVPAPPLPPFTLAVLTVYSFIALASWTWFSVRLARSVFQQLPHLMAALPPAAVAHDLPMFAAGGVVAGALVLAWRLRSRRRLRD